MLLQDYSESEGSSPHNLRLLSDALGPTYKIPIQGKDHALHVLHSKANLSAPLLPAGLLPALILLAFIHLALSIQLFPTPSFPTSSFSYSQLSYF